MAYLPRRFKTLLEMLHGQLSAIKDALKDQKSAIDSAAESYANERRDQPRIVIAPAPTDQEHKDANREKEKDRTVQRVIAVATSTAAIAGLIYGGIAAIQACLMRETYREIQSQTKAAERSAYAACKSAEVARDIFIQAYNGEADTHATARGSIQQALAITESVAAVVEPDIEVPNVINGLYQTPFTMHNNGSSDARNIVAKIRAIYLPKGTEPSFDYKHFTTTFVAPVLKKGEYGTPRMAAPVIEGNGSILAESKSTHALLVSEDAHIFVYGHINYLDVFGFSRWRNFCALIHWGNRDKEETLGQHGSTPKCTKYNQEESLKSIPGEKFIPPLAITIPSEIACEKPSD